MVEVKFWQGSGVGIETITDIAARWISDASTADVSSSRHRFADPRKHP